MSVTAVRWPPVYQNEGCLSQYLFGSCKPGVLTHHGMHAVTLEGSFCFQPQQVIIRLQLERNDEGGRSPPLPQLACTHHMQDDIMCCPACMDSAQLRCTYRGILAPRVAQASAPWPWCQTSSLQRSGPTGSCAQEDRTYAAKRC